MRYSSRYRKLVPLTSGQHLIWKNNLEQENNFFNLDFLRVLSESQIEIIEINIDDFKFLSNGKFPLKYFEQAE